MSVMWSFTYPGAAGQAQQVAHQRDEHHEVGGASTLPQHRGEHVQQSGVHRGDHRELCAQPQRDEHHEEEHGPERGDGQAGHHFGVHDERQTRAWNAKREKLADILESYGSPWKCDRGIKWIMG